MNTIYLDKIHKNELLYLRTRDYLSCGLTTFTLRTILNIQFIFNLQGHLT